jgi:hypothetical protein
MRRSPLKRRTPLTAKTELKRTTALGRSPLARSSLNAGSAARKTAPKRRTPSPIPAKVRAALKLRSGGLCEIAAAGCTETATDASHRIKIGMGGRKGSAGARHHVLSNLLHACRGCHSGALHAAPAAAYWRGWMLREHEDPRTVPCLYRGLWVLLADDGSLSPTTSTPEEATMPNYVQKLTRDLADRLPDCGMDLIDLYALLALTRGTDTTLKDVHDAWSVWRNTSKPDHKSLIPFEQLTVEVQELDRIYMTAIHETAKAAAR